MKYLVTLNGRTLAVTLDGARVSVDGVEHQAELRALSVPPLRLLLQDGRAFTLPIWSGGRGAWTVLADGERVEVEALDERTAHIRSLARNSVIPAGPVTLKAPMPGLVVRVLVTPGQKVVEGSSLIVLEAMKMENELKAAAPGIVVGLSVTPGRTVERGEVLITFGDA